MSQSHLGAPRISRVLALLLIGVLFLGACADSDPDDEVAGQAVTPTVVPEPTATAVPPTAIPIPPTATPAPPIATAVPPTPTSTATPTPTAQVDVTIGCTIEPERAVQVREILTFRAVQSPADVDVDYAFEHGDGTLDPGAVSSAYYEAPGSYDVVLQWSHAGGSGKILCGTVTVLAVSPTPFLSREAAAVVRLVTVDNSFEPGSRPFTTVIVGLDTGDGRKLSPEAQAEITARLSGIATVEFTDDAEAAITALADGFSGTAVVRILDIRVGPDTTALDMDLTCGSLCGIALTYGAAQGASGGWVILGTIGPIIVR